MVRLCSEGGLSRGGFSCDFGGVRGTFAVGVSSALGICEAPSVTTVSIVRYARGDLGALMTPTNANGPGGSGGSGGDGAGGVSGKKENKDGGSVAAGHEASVDRDSRWSSGSGLVAALYTPVHQPRVMTVGPFAVPTIGGGTIQVLGHGLTNAAARSSAEATASCFFGTVGPVLGASVAGSGGGTIECRTPAAPPGIRALRFALGGSTSGLWATAKPVGVADGGGEVAVLPLRVLPLTGNLDGVMPSAVMLDGSSPMLHAVGFGLQPPAERGTENDGLTPVPVPRGVNADGSSSGMAPPVACAVGQMAAEVADRVIEVRD